MRQWRAGAAAALAVCAVALACLAGCARPGSTAARQVPPARLERIAGTVSVVLTPLGAQRIGVVTEPSTATGAMTVVPYDALLYEPDGRTAVYVESAPLTYTRYFVTVADITADQVFVSQGLAAGVQVVTVGAEELLGVQNGVGVQT